jgi:exonuclease III
MMRSSGLKCGTFSLVSWLAVGRMPRASYIRVSASAPFWDYFRIAWARDAGLRIDPPLLSPSIAARLVSAGVNREVRGWQNASDHPPT